MDIRKALPNEVDRLMPLYEDGKRALAALGIDQWQDGHPDRATIAEDVARGETYVAEDADGFGAVAMIGAGGEPDYDRIDGAWLTPGDAHDPQYLVVHRIASASDHAHRGCATALIEEAERQARERGRKSVRIDTHAGNVRMRGLVTKLGFKECGIIMLSGNREATRERIAYEKLV